MRTIMTSATQGLLLVLAGIANLVTIYPTKTYRPEAHYMRGPGPKWREKHMK
jgi:hypothetical protein